MDSLALSGWLCAHHLGTPYHVMQPAQPVQHCCKLPESLVCVETQEFICASKARQVRRSLNAPAMPFTNRARRHKWHSTGHARVSVSSSPRSTAAAGLQIGSRHAAERRFGLCAVGCAHSAAHVQQPGCQHLGSAAAAGCLWRALQLWRPRWQPLHSRGTVCGRCYGSSPQPADQDATFSCMKCHMRHRQWRRLHKARPNANYLASRAVLLRLIAARSASGGSCWMACTTSECCSDNPRPQVALYE
jgi:hypothetical protein